jgi:hypothetical protein
MTRVMIRHMAVSRLPDGRSLALTMAMGEFMRIHCVFFKMAIFAAVWQLGRIATPVANCWRSGTRRHPCRQSPTAQSHFPLAVQHAGSCNGYSPNEARDSQLRQLEGEQEPRALRHQKARSCSRCPAGSAAELAVPWRNSVGKSATTASATLPRRDRTTRSRPKKLRIMDPPCRRARSPTLVAPYSADRQPKSWISRGRARSDVPTSGQGPRIRRNFRTMHRTFIVAAVTSLVLPGLYSVAVADTVNVIPGSNFNAGTYWKGAAYASSGTFAYCTMHASYNNTFLFFSLSNNFEEFMISMADASWTLPADQILYATISLDGGWSGSYKGVVAASNMITFHFTGDDNAHFVKALALGRTLRVETSKKRWMFTLLGTEIAMPQLIKCAAAYSDQERQGNPFDAKQ